MDSFHPHLKSSLSQPTTTPNRYCNFFQFSTTTNYIPTYSIPKLPSVIFLVSTFPPSHFSKAHSYSMIYILQYTSPPLYLPLSPKLTAFIYDSTYYTPLPSPSPPASNSFLPISIFLFLPYTPFHLSPTLLYYSSPAYL